MIIKYARRWPDRLPAWLLRFFINIWPPYLGTGISVRKIAADFGYIEVTIKLHWYCKNLVGTHFGGSMYAMTDPFYMLILLKKLGRDYIVWDKAAYIEFKKPGRGKLTAVFQFAADEIQAIRNQADTNEKFIFDKSVDLIDQDGVVVASVVKTLYVRKKPHD